MPHQQITSRYSRSRCSNSNAMLSWLLRVFAKLFHMFVVYRVGTIGNLINGQTSGNYCIAFYSFNAKQKELLNSMDFSFASLSSLVWSPFASFRVIRQCARLGHSLYISSLFDKASGPSRHTHTRGRHCRTIRRPKRTTNERSEKWINQIYLCFLLALLIVRPIARLFSFSTGQRQATGMHVCLASNKKNGLVAVKSSSTKWGNYSRWLQKPFRKPLIHRHPPNYITIGMTLNWFIQK